MRASFHKQIAMVKRLAQIRKLVRTQVLLSLMQGLQKGPERPAVANVFPHLQ